MRRAKRMGITVTAIAMVATLAASSFPAGAVNGDNPCPEGSSPLTVAVDGVEAFVCVEGFEIFCPAGFVEGPVPEEIEEQVGDLIPFACVPAPPDGGGGGVGGGGGGAVAPLELTQETEQEAESGDIDQSFDVSQTGDNSNQCAGVQGVSNTGNPQNVTDLLQAASAADDFEFEEVGPDITASPESSTTCEQQVNQAASASG